MKALEPVSVLTVLEGVDQWALELHVGFCCNRQNVAKDRESQGSRMPSNHPMHHLFHIQPHHRFVHHRFIQKFFPRFILNRRLLCCVFVVLQGFFLRCSIMAGLSSITASPLGDKPFIPGMVSIKPSLCFPSIC